MTIKDLAGTVMTSIIRAQATDFQLLAEIGKKSFIESHGSSAAPEDINRYVQGKFSCEAVRDDLDDLNNIYHLIYHDDRPAGYSKIILNSTHPDIPAKNITKLERLYLLKDFYGLKLGHELIGFNMDLSRKSGQEGMWLFVWKKNDRAVQFYLKTGFAIIGSYDFKLTETHSNPNYNLFLKYSDE